MTPQMRNIILFGGIAAVLVFVYFYFIKSGPEDQSGLVVSPATGLPGSQSFGDAGVQVNSQVTTEFLGILLNIKSIKLNDSILSDEAFTTLVDSSIILTPDSVAGRPNPFAPIGSDQPTSTSPSGSQSSSSSSGTSEGGASQ